MSYFVFSYFQAVFYSIVPYTGQFLYDRSKIFNKTDDCLFSLFCVRMKCKHYPQKSSFHHHKVSF